MTSVFVALVGIVAVTRLVELGVSRRHRRALTRRGARTLREPAFAGMVALHVAILTGSLVEVVAFERAAPLALGLFAALVVALSNALRIAAIKSLGELWTVRVVDSIGLGVVRAGPYRFIRHPNYVAVFLELTFLPLVHGAWITALVGTTLHLAVLAKRIRLEESVLLADPAYVASMGDTPRFVPRLFARPVMQARAEEP